MPDDRFLLRDDCFAPDDVFMRHETAIRILRERLHAVTGVETLPLTSAVGRIAATETRANRPNPPLDNSAVDGYAFRHADLLSSGGVLAVSGRAAAGDRQAGKIPNGSAVRIFTGAAMPVGADTVAMQEDCRLEVRDGRAVVLVPEGLPHGANRRKAGEDMCAGDVLFTPGQILRPQDIAAAAIAGHPRIAVHAKLKIALFSTGDEIIATGREAGDHQLFDANRPMLGAMLDRLPVEVTDLGILPDDSKRIARILDQAADQHDAVLATGGASIGEEDHLARQLALRGTSHVWQLAIKPGRPMRFGQITGVPVFALPGNPVAAFVCFSIYIRSSIIALAGGNWQEPARFILPAGFEVSRKKAGRREFWRGWIETDASGNSALRKFERDGSGLITGLRRASGLIEVAEEVTKVQKGDPLGFIPFSELGM